MQFDKFRLLCWKNFTLQKRHPIAGLLEILFPIVIVVLFTFARSNTEPETAEQLSFVSFQPDTFSECLTPTFEKFEKIGVSPGNNSAIVGLLNSISKAGIEIEFFENSAALERFLTNENTTAIGIQFDDGISNSDDLPKKLKYSIRLPQDPKQNTWLTDQLYYVSLSKTAREGLGKTWPTQPPYNDLCFLRIQTEIDRAFIQNVTNKPSPVINLNRFPYPSITEDKFAAIAGPSFPLLLVLCLIMASKNIIKNVTVERETQLKETMKMMGLSSSLHWLAWFTKSLVMLEISFLGMLVLMCTPIMTSQPIFGHSNPFLVWLFFNIYGTSVITFGFFVSVIFKKSTTAANVGSLLFFVTMIPFNKFMEDFYAMNYIVKVIYCSLVNSGMGQGLVMMLVEEGNGDGLTFSNLFSRTPDIGFSIGEVMLSLILGIVIQMLLTLYIERVVPGDIGIPEPWYFPVKPIYTYIKSKMGYNTLINQDAILQERRISGADYEEEPLNVKSGIRIADLSKAFGSKLAVNKLNLNIFEDQITVLLGHNGAGKTTTMSILSGMYPPSSGTAYLNGKDIRTEINEARSSLGLCPQHNILFDDLTVKEHIIFFARLKGMTSKLAISDEVRRYVSLLELKDKANTLSSTLSGGMKRKLSIGIALCANSKIVICDEPSSGMDPAGRRALWDLLIAEKKGRTILISTHHMDEADVLGDRIAIMSEGSLRTAGSSFFLKKKFGTGYKLICVKQPTCNANLVLDALRQFAPDAYIESDSQTEVIFIISETHLPIFESIFKRLEDDAKQLGISSFGCNLSTLEEVFLKLGTESSRFDPEEDHHLSENTLSTSISVNDLMSGEKVTGMTLILYQIYATFLKKIHYFRRNYRSFLYLGLFTAWMIFILMAAPDVSFFSAPARAITLDSYDKTTTIIEYDNSAVDLMKSYQNLMGGKHAALPIQQDMSTFYLQKASASVSMTNREYLVGATMKEEGITAWFNGQPYHTMPLTVNLMSRAILKSQGAHDYDIFIVNQPYIWENNAGNSGRSELIKGLIMPIILIFMLAIYWPSIFMGFYVKERESRAKLLQYISGANRFVYWFTSFLFDLVIFSLIFCAIVGGIGAYQKEQLSSAQDLGLILLILVFYAFAMLPFVYAFSYLFISHSTAESMTSLVGFIFAILYGVWAILKFLVNKPYAWILADVIYWVGLMFAPFSLLDALRVALQSKLMGKADQLFTFSTDGVGRNLLMMFVGGTFFLTVCLIKDFMLFDWFIYKYLMPKRKLPELSAETDEDVKNETDRIKKMTDAEIESGNMVLKGLTKFYGNHLAANQLHLAVGASECFGLLGINGAGKTTTFKMMTGDEIISAGDAYIRGFSMRNQMHKVHQLIGYCPQFDALLMDLSGRETIKIFSLLRGIPIKDISEMAIKLSSELGFHQHLDKKISAYSGGNKRKLSTALALIGDPSLIFLDEPTTGMDPGAKRQLWNIINKTRNSGRSVVMTSHSMEECEALCTKIAIMVNGEFKCLGSTQHLKNKFSKGFILTVKVGHDDDSKVEEIRNRIQQMFPSAQMKEKYLDILTFHITESLKWSQIFGMMAQMKNEIGIADYALTQTSLEQVFLFFTKSGLYQKDTAQ